MKTSTEEFHLIFPLVRSAPGHRLSSGRTQVQLGLISKAKIQTIRVTGVLVAGFIICWTPYNVMSLWWWIGKPCNLKINKKKMIKTILRS